MRQKLIKTALHFYWRFARGMTLGVRAIVENDKNEIIMVRHTYVKGWHLPGGGVENGETVEQAIRKELREEANIELTGRPKLVAFFKNTLASKRDHVAMFHARDFEAGPLPEPNNEIAEVNWFDPSNLPTGTTPATARRVAEFLNNQVPDQYW